MIDELRKINRNLLFSAKTNEEKKIQKTIMNILEDNNCFIKMNIEEAYNILRDLKIKEEEIKNTYTQLVTNGLKRILEK